MTFFWTIPFSGSAIGSMRNTFTPPRRPHNAYLATAADLGLVGLIAYLLFLLSGLIAAFRASLRSPRGARLGTVGFLTMYLIVGFVERKRDQRWECLLSTNVIRIRLEYPNLADCRCLAARFRGPLDGSGAPTQAQACP